MQVQDYDEDEEEEKEEDFSLDLSSGDLVHGTYKSSAISIT